MNGVLGHLCAHIGPAKLGQENDRKPYVYVYIYKCLTGYIRFSSVLSVDQITDIRNEMGV